MHETEENEETQNCKDIFQYLKKCNITKRKQIKNTLALRQKKQNNQSIEENVTE